MAQDLSTIRERTVHLLAYHDGGRKSLSGFAVAEDLVLTCAHDLVDAVRIEAHAVGADRVVVAEVVWKRTDLDVAILRAPGLGVSIHAGVSWGEFQGYTGSVKVIGFGYPGANRVGDEEAVDRGFHVAQLDGEIIPGEGRERGSLVFRLSPGQVDDDEFWGGASGAALFDADRQRLIGVVAERLNPWKNRWDLVPVSDFARVEDLPEPVRGQRLWEVQDPDRLIESAYRPRPAQLTDFMRLTARYGYVPYLERSHEEPLEKLLDWCAGDLDSRISISVLTGQAGAGKTRLAAHLCTVLQKDTGSHETNWEAGFARTDRVDGWSRFLPARPTLVVFDYTDRERARASLTAWIRYLNTEADRCPKVRILLVNRHSGGWLQELDAPTEGLASELQRSGHHLDLRKNDEAEGDGFDAEIRREHAHEAYRRFRNAGADDPTPEDLLDFAADERIDSPLLVHIAALLAARDQPLPDRGSGDGDAGELRDELLRMLFERERKRWNEHRALSLTEEPPSNSDEAGHAMAIVNLIQPDRSEVKDYLSASPLWMDARTAERQAAAKALHTLYPGAMRPISENQAVPTVAAMEPDLISEYLLATIDADDLALIVKQLHTLDLYGRHFDRMLHLAALAEDHYEHIRGVLDGTVDRFLRLVVGEDEDASASAPQILATRLDHLVKTAVSKAAETDPQSVPNQLTTALQRYGGHPSVAEAATNLEAKVPFPTPNRQTGELALKLESLAVQNLESADEGPELALHLNLLGQRLNELGRHDEALLHYERALALYEDLAADNPAHLPHLARNHNNLGYGLGELGRHGKALPHHERALALYEDLAADNPAHLPYLARSHHNLGYGLNELGRHGKALPHHERALALYEDLAADNPAHLPHLANSHNNLGSGLNKLGRHGKALPHHERALALYEDLAADNPAHLPHLANSHNDLGSGLNKLGRHGKALPHHERALALYEDLAADNPAHLPYLARSHHNLGYGLNELGRHGKALPHHERALALYEDLAADNPAHLPHLANSHHNLGYGLGELGRHDEALPHHERALELRKSLAADNPAHLPHLANSHNNLGYGLGGLGRHGKALPHHERALALYEDLAADNPAHLPHLANSHHNLGYGLNELGRHDEALPHHERALELRKSLAADNPAHLPHLAHSHNNLGYGLNELGRHDEALPHHERALELRKSLAADNPAHLPHLAGSHHNLGYTLTLLSRVAEAHFHHLRAAEIFQQLATDIPVPYAEHYQANRKRANALASQLAKRNKARAAKAKRKGKRKK